jgi:hypothetical protein
MSPIGANMLCTDDEERFRRILASQILRYPQMQIEDLYKLVYQAALGSEHAVPVVEAARAWLEHEFHELSEGPEEPIVDVISADGQIARVNLRPYVVSGGDPSLLLDAFIRTAEEYRGTQEKLLLHWSCAERIASVGQLPFGQAELESFFGLMQAQGLPAVHHSPRYEAAYHPAYRVIVREFLPSR